MLCGVVAVRGGVLVVVYGAGMWRWIVVLVYGGGVRWWCVVLVVVCGGRAYCVCVVVPLVCSNGGV